jgi:ParB family chromosome partitioning protein
MATNDPSIGNANQKKSRLGRGLGSLLGGGDESVLGKTVDASGAFEVEVSKEEVNEEIERHPSHFEGQKEGQNRVWNMEIEKVVANQQQPRKHFEKQKLEELAASIKEQGILSPIIVRKAGENYEIIAGERRWRAAQMAGLQRVPVIVKEAEEKKALEWALIENIQRADLNPMEEALAYKKLIDDYQISQQDVAQKVGKDRTTVTNSLRLLSLPPEVTELIRTQEISTGHAKVLLGLGDPKMQIDLAKSIRDQKMSVRAAEKMTHLLKGKSASAAKTVNEKEALRMRLIEQVKNDLQKALGSKVSIDYKNNGAKAKGKISLHFYSDEQFNHLVDKIKD